MVCPKCGKELNDNSKFCKYCGAQIKAKNNSNVQKNNNEKKKNILIISLIIVIIIVCIACVLIASGTLNNQLIANNNSVDSQSNTKQPLNIINGSFSTGSADEDLTYGDIYVGSQHSGETVKISAIWSRDGSDLNSENILTKTVDSSGHVKFNSDEGFLKYPDQAIIKLYYADGNLSDSKTVTLSPSAGTQSF